MTAALYDSSVFEDHNRVGVLHGGKSMRYDEHRSALHKPIGTALNEKFGSRIDRTRRLVHYHNGRVGNRRSRYRQQLPLTLRKVGSVVGQHRVIAVGKSGNEIVGVGDSRRGINFFVGGGEPTVTDILHNRAGKQTGIL